MGMENIKELKKHKVEDLFEDEVEYAYCIEDVKKFIEQLNNSEENKNGLE